MIKSYLGNITNDHKTLGKWKVHSDNAIIDYKLKGNGKFN